eukprot:scaffold291199_cov35-Tisochrysis_lutea.AAC.2
MQALSLAIRCGNAADQSTYMYSSVGTSRQEYQLCTSADVHVAMRRKADGAPRCLWLRLNLSDSDVTAGRTSPQKWGSM